jgi:hypothetical protein
MYRPFHSILHISIITCISATSILITSKEILVDSFPLCFSFTANSNNHYRSESMRSSFLHRSSMLLYPHYLTSKLLCNSKQSLTITEVQRVAFSTTKHKDGIPIHMLNSTLNEEGEANETADKEARNSSSTTLSWDKFEYSTNPKLDIRFGKVEYNTTHQSTSTNTTSTSTTNATDTSTTTATKQELFEALQAQEALYDQQFSRTCQTQHQLWNTIPSATIQIGIEFLQQYIQPSRQQKIHSVLQQRTQNVRFLFESTFVLQSLYNMHTFIYTCMHIELLIPFDLHCSHYSFPSEFAATYINVTKIHPTRVTYTPAYGRWMRLGYNTWIS